MRLEALFDLAEAGTHARAAEPLPSGPSPTCWQQCLPLVQARASGGPSGRFCRGLRGPLAPWGGLAIEAGTTLARGDGGSPVGLHPLLSWLEPGGHRTLFRGAQNHRPALAQPTGARQLAGCRAARPAVVFRHASGRCKVGADRGRLVVSLCRRRSWLSLAFPRGAVALQRHVFRCPLPVAAPSPGVFPSGHHDRRLGCLGDGHRPRLSHVPASVGSLSRPRRRLAPPAGAGAQWPSRRLWADQRKALLHPPSKRTVRRRLNTLQAEVQGSPAPAVVPRLLATLPQLLPAVGSTWRPTTSNAAARFLGALERYRVKGPFQNLASARACRPLHVRLGVRDVCSGSRGRTTRPMPSANGRLGSGSNAVVACAQSA